jgi:hypothetical protein
MISKLQKPRAVCEPVTGKTCPRKHHYRRWEFLLCRRFTQVEGSLYRWPEMG